MRFHVSRETQTEYLTQFRSILAWHAGRYFLTHLTTERRQAGAWRRRLGSVTWSQDQADSQPLESWTSTTLILPIYATSCVGLSLASSGPAAHRRVLFAGGRPISKAACDMARLSVRVGFLSIGNPSLHCFPSTKSDTPMAVASTRCPPFCGRDL
ncbi:hypothetical protein EV401DRAFT_453895 [Pisolithus croceorrhizus]|nr:hypothetical protein EV401DRAFT_453895 [Pisolithus croceorrhizus]